MPQSISIDSFLDVHSDNKAIVFCGKLAIAYSILKAEFRSLLYLKDLYSMLSFKGDLEKTWFNGFMQLLTEGCHKENLRQRFSSIALIIFNYDRCVEHFIYHSLRSYYGIDGAKAADIIKGIEIYHPYRCVGSLPYLSKESPNSFGEIPHPTNLPILAKQIKTFTEGTDKDSSDIVAIRRHMKTALRLVFLGFAFQEKNMELLEPEQYIRDRKVFATCQGISSSRVTTISHRFGPKDPSDNRVIYIGDHGLNFHDMKCSQLVNDFSHDFLLIQ